MEDLTVAAVNFRAEFGRVDLNLCRMRKWVASLAEQGADIICFPEMSICGYDHTWQISPYLETIPGDVTVQLSEIAATYHVVLIAGLAEFAQPAHHTQGVVQRAQGVQRYISQLLIGAEGVMGVYRKTHLSPHEEKYFLPGNELPVFDHPKARLGILICHDLRYPEPGTILALHGAEVIFACMAASPRGKDSVADILHRLLPARALDNTIYLVACNQTGIGHRGQVFGGAALVAGPTGEILKESVTSEESALVYRLRADVLHKYRRSRDTHCLLKRRPALYGDLTHPGPSLQQ